MSIFISGSLLSLSLCLDLGIVNVATIKAGIEKGFIPALLIGLGAGIGDIIYACISSLGISVILNNHLFKYFLWIGGTLILLYMCCNMIKETIHSKAYTFDKNNEENFIVNKKDFFYGISLSLASPSSIIWFATIGGSAIASTNMSGATSILLFFSGFFITSEIWSTFVAFLSSRGSKYMNLKTMKVFSILSAVLFLYFAIKIFVSGIQTLI